MMLVAVEYFGFCEIKSIQTLKSATDNSYTYERRPLQFLLRVLMSSSSGQHADLARFSLGATLGVVAVPTCFVDETP